MPLFLTDAQIAGLVSVRDAIDVLEKAFGQQSAGQATNTPRQRLAAEGSFLHMLAGAVPGYFGYKAYATGHGTAQFKFFLFDSSTCDLLAVMEADRLGQTRTGAATGLATRLLARDDVRVATIFGAGWQAESQLLAMDAVRDLSSVWVVNRDSERARRFIDRMSPEVRAELKPATNPEEAVRASRLVTTITNSREPVLPGAWVERGTHVNAAGGNMLLRSEVDAALIVASDRLVVDSIEQARMESGDFLSALLTGRRHWDEVRELKDVVKGWGGREGPEERTLFNSLGIGLEDVALGVFVYQRALERGVGRNIDL
jgi:alanine dehydrogenase